MTSAGSEGDVGTGVLTVNPGSNSLRLDAVEVAADSPPRLVDSQHTGESPTSGESLRAFDEFLERCRSTVRGVAHRLVHGGRRFPRPELFGQDTVDALHELEPLAPKHVPSTVQLLQRAGHAAPELPQAVCPDTAFHETLPEAARVEPVPERWREATRRFGFHGISYAWALRRAGELLRARREDIDVLVAHLGGGSSVCAVRSGASVATSMGLTPLSGVVMARRSGDVDPGALLWLLRHEEVGLDELSDSLHGESGLYGLSGGYSDDTRELVAEANRGGAAAGLAIEVFCRRAAEGLAAMATHLRRVDAVVFTGEIGWNQPEVREGVCERLALLGVPAGLSGNRAEDGVVSRSGASPPVLVVEPREELQLASEAAPLFEDTAR
ncbi:MULTISPECIES: acetate/propionate family kinase [Actinopolyspora]|nr:MULTISPECIES: acetate/propionate family kinase [Actinopolyspora]NHD15826.1 acetate kinase [Actinopolyspora sp. BKK2]NHE74960.1 acetate kinase [Actinopolyspora sp. BKK1]